jgi:hypothetical protein
MAVKENSVTFNALVDEIHRERHGLTCADIHPLVHEANMRGFEAAALRLMVQQRRTR